MIFEEIYDAELSEEDEAFWINVSFELMSLCLGSSLVVGAWMIEFYVFPPSFNYNWMFELLSIRFWFIRHQVSFGLDTGMLFFYFVY